MLRGKYAPSSKRTVPTKKRDRVKNKTRQLWSSFSLASRSLPLAAASIRFDISFAQYIYLWQVIRKESHRLRCRNWQMRNPSKSIGIFEQIKIASSALIRPESGQRETGRGRHVMDEVNANRLELNCISKSSHNILFL